MELAVATVFVSPIVKLLITKLSSYCSTEIALVWGVKGQLEKLARTLELIDAVLQDAEIRQEKSNLLVIWLGKLKDVARDAEEILDELQYEDLRRKAKNEGNILRLLPSKPFGLGSKIAHKIKDVNTQLDAITKDMKRFNFINQSGSSGSNTVVNGNIPEASSHINDSAAVVGREDDLSKVLDLLIDTRPNYNQESYSVVRITGMGGIGKTTLAQLVYATADHFQIKLWVSVSRKSDVKEIFGDLLEPNVDRQSSLNATKDRLKERLKGVKCLIVLDDVWTNHGFDVDELLKDILSMSFEGSKILMTMRSTDDIPPMTDCLYKIYQLQCLPEDDCWSIINRIAFAHGGAKETPNLSNIGKQIASKCGGLPLAAKTLGGLLYYKKNEEEWLSILNNPIWNLSSTGENNKILSILKLSYDHLSPYVKQCFSYCLIVPKGHSIVRKDIIRMWTAEGFLNSSHNASPATVGNEYFNMLFHNSFFEVNGRSKWGDIKSCRMHDLVHDLAVLVAGSESRTLKVSSKNYHPEVIMESHKFRYLSLEILDTDVSAIPSEIYKASKLHTFLPLYPLFYGANGNWVWVKQISCFSFLRVLHLGYSGIAELPQSICKLKHLRYLDLSFTEIKTFPSSFGQLYNLQTFKFIGCRYIKELPKDIRKLIGLEYFIFNDKGNQLTQMPREVSKCINLKELSVFVVGIGKGYGIEELKNLNLLGGKLVIGNLGCITDAKQANLMGKEKIIHLQLRWDSRSCGNSDRYNKDTQVINDLQPHRSLKRLGISNFAGSEFPTWMMSASIHLPNLVYVTLQSCVNCEHLPALGRLQSLRFLRMESMDAIKRIGNEFYQSNGEASFPSLVELYLWSFPNLEEWLGEQTVSTSCFPYLETLEILACPNLSTTPTEFPSLKKLNFPIELINRPNFKSLPIKLFQGANNVLQTLRISSCDAFVGFLGEEQEQPDYQPDHLSSNSLSVIEIVRCPSLTVLPARFRGLNSLTYLAIKECTSLRSLPEGIQLLPALQKLIIGGFSEDLLSFPFPAPTGSDGEQYFISLGELTLLGWPTLAVLPDQLQHLTSLHRLKISDFSCLLSLPEWFGELSSLQTLDIENCSRLEYLPSKEQMMRLTSLQNLNIKDCPLLQKRCSSGGEEWHKIALLKQVSRSSPSLLDHITRDADMNIELLARRRRGIFLNQNKEKCWIDSSGRNCFMLFPRSLQIAWEEDTRYWTWLSIIEPSASDDVEIEVPELVKVCYLGVSGIIDISKLSPGIKYEVVFLVMFREDSYGWEAPVDVCLVHPDGQRLIQKTNLQNMPKAQWIEIHVGDFQTSQQPGDQGKEVSFIMSEHGGHWKSGLVIEGAIIRPKK